MGSKLYSQSFLIVLLVWITLETQKKPFLFLGYNLIFEICGSLVLETFVSGALWPLLILVSLTVGLALGLVLADQPI